MTENDAIAFLEQAVAKTGRKDSASGEFDLSQVSQYLRSVMHRFESDGRQLLEECITELRMHDANESHCFKADVIQTVIEMVGSLGQEYAKKFIFNSLVGLAIEYEWVEDASKNGIGVFSGMIAEFGGEWYWVTAGHIYEDVFEPVKRNKIKIRQLRIIDGAGLNPKTSEGFTIDLDLCNCGFYYSKEFGLDIGFIHLRQYYRELLAANDIRPVVESMWAPNQDNRSALGYALVGFPRELLTEQQATFTVKAEFIPIRPTNAPGLELHRSIDRFYAHVPEALRFKSIKGMSGGPIIKFKQKESGELFFWIVGVQNSWDPNKRILAACPADIVKRAFVDWIAASQEHDR